MNKLLGYTLAVGLSSVAVSALADEDMMKSMDTNTDGSISKEEFTAVHDEQKFTEMDANQDGMLSADEQGAMMEMKKDMPGSDAEGAMDSGTSGSGM